MDLCHRWKKKEKRKEKQEKKEKKSYPARKVTQQEKKKEKSYPEKKKKDLKGTHLKLINGYFLKQRPIIYITWKNIK